jgi:hypothetical protein
VTLITDTSNRKYKKLLPVICRGYRVEARYQNVVICSSHTSTQMRFSTRLRSFLPTSPLLLLRGTKNRRAQRIDGKTFSNTSRSWKKTRQILFQYPRIFLRSRAALFYHRWNMGQRERPVQVGVGGINAQRLLQLQNYMQRVPSELRKRPECLGRGAEGKQI